MIIKLKQIHKKINKINFYINANIFNLFSLTTNISMLFFFIKNTLIRFSTNGEIERYIVANIPISLVLLIVLGVLKDTCESISGKETLLTAR